MSSEKILFPEVTVITVCKNAGDDMIRTCKSVLDQTDVSLQYVIQDGVSSDFTLSYLESLQDSRISLISEPDLGIYDAMNRAFNRVEGKWCIYLNAGDLFYSTESLRNILAEAQADTNIDLFVFAYRNEFNKSVTIHPKKISRYFLYRNSICHQVQFWKTEVLRRYIPFDKAYQILADQHLLVRAFCSGITIKSSPMIEVSYKGMGFSMLPSVRKTKKTERVRIQSSSFEPFERYVYGTFEIILLKPIRMYFNQRFRGTKIFVFYKYFANFINHLF
jgi:glycosyltransferase involved in cell wall biosynthesis